MESKRKALGHDPALNRRYSNTHYANNDKKP